MSTDLLETLWSVSKSETRLDEFQALKPNRKPTVIGYLHLTKIQIQI